MEMSHGIIPNRIGMDDVTAEWLRAAVQDKPGIVIRGDERSYYIPFIIKHWPELYREGYSGSCTIHLTFPDFDETVAVFSDHSKDLGKRCREYFLDLCVFRDKWLEIPGGRPSTCYDRMPAELCLYIPAQAAQWLIIAVLNSRDVTFAPFSMDGTYVHLHHFWPEMFEVGAPTEKPLFLRGKMDAVANVVSQHSRLLGDKSRAYLCDNFSLFNKWM